MAFVIVVEIEKGSDVRTLRSREDIIHGARRYIFRFDPILSSSSNDCSHPPPTDSSRLTNVLSVYSLHKTFLPPYIYVQGYCLPYGSISMEAGKRGRSKAMREREQKGERVSEER